MILTDAMKRLTDLYQDTTEATLDAALGLCARGSVAEPVPGTFLVRDDEESYNVQGQTCDCDPLRAEGETEPVCVHVIAVELYRLLQDGTPLAEPVAGVVVPIVERHIEKIVEMHGAVMHEAPYSVNLTVEDTEGYNLMFTVRKQDSHQFFEAIQGLRSWVKKQGFRPAARSYRPAPNGHAEDKREERVAPAQEPPVHSADDGRPVRRFCAETLHRSELDGKVLWAVKGADMPRYNQKYGLRIWPEILSEHFDMNEDTGLPALPVRDFPSLKGWIAEYVMRIDGDNSKPDKVVRLVKER